MNNFEGEHQANDYISPEVAKLIKKEIIERDNKLLERASEADSLVDRINERYKDIEAWMYFWAYKPLG